jgi:CRP/FNR family transcriptional regulator, cyclic AMP receptor protein
VPDFSSGFFDYPSAEGQAPRDQLTFLPDRPEEDWALLLEHTETLRFSPGAEVIRAGDPDRALFMLTAGELTARAGARDFKTIQAPSVVGEVAFLDGGARSITLVALTEVEVRKMSLESFEVLSARYPELGRAVLFDLGRIVAARLRIATDLLERG